MDHRASSRRGYAAVPVRALVARFISKHHNAVPVSYRSAAHALAVRYPSVAVGVILAPAAVPATHAVDVVPVLKGVAVSSLYLALTAVAVNVNALVLNAQHVQGCAIALVLALNVHHVQRRATPV